MPTILQNQQTWNAEYNWRQQGEEWSSAWGGSEAQWFGAIYPRVHAFLPAGTVLEIAPGYGRWTNFLKEYCEHLVVIDLAEKCIEDCRQRFASNSHITYYVNDGKSLAMLQDSSIDFAFSFDSLVHADSDVIEEYLRQLSVKLKLNGVGIIHHSNLGKYQEALSVIEKIPDKLRELLINKNFLNPTHWRSLTMSNNLFEDYCNKYSLQCIGQELVNWGTEGLLIDCFSIFTPKNSIWSRPNRVVENTEFMNEAYLIRRLSHMYTVKSFQENSGSHKQGENGYLRQQVAPMGKTWHELLAAQQALNIVQHTRTCRLLRKIGRWKFIERMLPPSPNGSLPLPQIAGTASSGSYPVEHQHLLPVGAEPHAMSSPQDEVHNHWESEFDACYAKVREPKIRGGVDYLSGAEDRIVQRLRRLGIEVYDYEISVPDYRRYFSTARYLEDYHNYYPFILTEKSLEHYIAAKLLNLSKDDVYIDIASENSPVPEIYRRIFEVKTYRQDIAYPSGLNGDMIGGDASNMPIPNEFAMKMGLHCSFEHFEGNSDIGFIREISRVLKPGGSVCIIPLYLFEEYVIQTDPVVAHSSGNIFEDDTIVYCAEGWNNRHGRFYDPEHLISRVYKNLSGLTVELYRIVNFKQVDQSCYVRFVMVIKKP